jgi:SAM-dependent methyltransferase
LLAYLREQRSWILNGDARGVHHRRRSPMARRAISQQFDELARAGPEHLDATFVAKFDEKMPTDWSTEIATLLALGVGPTSTVVDLGAGTGTFAQAIAGRVSRCVAVDVSEAMVAAMRARGVQAVRAGFLTYEHEGEPPDAVFTSNAMHHLPDFWKMIALERVADMLRPGGVLRLRDFVYSFEPHEADQVFAAWLDQEVAQGWTAHDLNEHILDEHSTFTWLLEPMLERAGFEIHERSVREDRLHAAYTCMRR